MFSLIVITISLVILTFLACKVNGSPGNGTEHGNCTVAGQVCFADGTCGTDGYHY